MFCYLLWFALLLPLNAFAQSQMVSGSIQGSVTDVTGAALAGVGVTATHEDSAIKRTAETDEAGRFRFAGLPIGRYTLRFEKSGFAPVAVQPFLLSVGQIVVQNVELKPAELIQEVEVQEQAGTLDITAATPSVALGYDRVEEAPAPGPQLLELRSGCARRHIVQRLKQPARGADSGERSCRQRPCLWGLRGRNNSSTIDGVDNRDETTGGNRVSVGLEMVQEFRVSAVSLPAEYGGAAGGIVNVVTRSGTNVWHGDGTFFLQNELFNARRPDIDSSSKPLSRRYQPGTSISGPIRKDRTFVAAAVEQEWESDAEWSDVPADALDTINHALATPAFRGAGVHSVLRGVFNSEMRGTEASLKATHQVGIHSFTARYAFSRGRVSNAVQDVANFSDRSARGSSLTRDHSLVLGWTAVPAADFANDVRLQVVRRSVGLTPTGPGPMLEIPGVVTFGESYRLNGSRTEDSFEVVEGVNLVRGRHQLSLGANVQRVHLNARFADRFGGIFVFPTLGDFVAGQPDVFLQAFGNPRTRMATLPLGTWLQDRWQPGNGMSLDAGLRYDRQWMPAAFPADNRNFAPRLGLAWRPKETAPLVLRAGFGLFYDRCPWLFSTMPFKKTERTASNSTSPDRLRRWRLRSGREAPSVRRFQACSPRSTASIRTSPPRTAGSWRSGLNTASAKTPR